MAPASVEALRSWAIVPDLFRFMLFLNLMCVALDMGLTCQKVLSPKAERVSKMLMVTNQHNVWQYQRRMVILIGDGNTYTVYGNTSSMAIPTQCVAGVQVGHGLGKRNPEELQVALNVRLDILKLFYQ